MPEPPDGQPLVIPPDIPWQVQTAKLSDGSHIFTLRTPYCSITLHMTNADMKKLAAHLYNDTTGIQIASNGEGIKPTPPKEKP
jgi:hypothetical protein